MPGSWDPRDFPNLTDDDYVETSDETRRYNCIAYAAGIDVRRWWPDVLGIDYWPPGVPLDETLDAFVQAFGTLGYEPCDDGLYEMGFEKIALYEDRNHTPTHAAIQQQNGRWRSKLGDYEDIEHETLECLNSPDYGQPVLYLMRARADQVH
jgi:hypothetical protein